MKVFVIHAWNFVNASLYPHTCDGVEYIDAALKKIEKASSGHEFRIDKNSFVPGLTVQENLKNSMDDVDIIFVLLDGLRPNVTYELGYALAIAGKDKKKVICLKEKNATVLVRNYYHNPMKVPTKHNGDVIVYNPELDVSKHLCDYSGFIFLEYDRFDLDALEAMVKNEIDRWDNYLQMQKVKEGNVSENIKNDIEQQDKSEVERNQETNNLMPALLQMEPEQRFNVAMSLIITEKTNQAITLFNSLIDDAKYGPRSSFYIAICQYFLKNYYEATVFAIKSIAMGYESKESKVKPQTILAACQNYTGFTEWENIIKTE